MRRLGASSGCLPQAVVEPAVLKVMYAAGLCARRSRERRGAVLPTDGSGSDCRTDDDNLCKMVDEAYHIALQP